MSTNLPIPPWLLRRAKERLRFTTLLMILTFVIAFAFMNITPPPSGDLFVANIIAGVVIAFSVVVFLIARSDRLPLPRVLDLGLVYLVVAGFGVALAETYAVYDPYSVVRGVSWLCLLIVLFPLVVPATRGKVATASILAATMGPISLGIAVASGLEAPNLPTVLYLMLPNYLAAGLAMIIHSVVQRLRTDVTKAERMGAYKLVEPLGSGGMGEVWRATHQALARPAAIKLIRPETLSGRTGADVDTLKSRFKREARMTSQLTSPHTIQIYDFGVTEEGILYYVMELLDGTDLETLVEAHGPLDPRRAVDLLIQVCDSLAEAHESGLVHRDIKPANLYVCRLGREVDQIKVLDFGLVAIQGAEVSIDSNTIQGTPAYLAPEMIRGDHPDERVDVYALGCVGYWLLSGRLVFERQSAFKVLYAHVEEQPEPLSKRCKDLPQGLEELLLACLAKDPDRRPRDAGELGARLRALKVPKWDGSKAWWKEHAPQAASRSLPVSVTVDPTNVSTAIPRREP